MLESSINQPVGQVEEPEGDERLGLVKDRVKYPLKVPKWLLGLLVLGLLAGGSYVGYNQLAATQRQEARRRIPTVAVERIDVPVSISANGTVQPERSVNVSPKTSGVLKELLVKEGERVEKGQILAYMDDSQFQGQLTQAKGQVAAAQANLDRLQAGNRPQEIAQAEAQLASAQANLDRLQAGNRPQEIAGAQAQVASAKANLQQAELTYNQNQQLYKDGAISLRELDSSRSAYESAKAQVEKEKQALNLQQSGARKEEIEQAKAQVEQAKQALNLVRAGARPEEIAQAKAQVEQAKQALNLQEAGARKEEIAQAKAQVMSAEGSLLSVQTQIDDTVIRAPFSGIVTRKYAEPGSFVTPTTSSSSVSSATSSSILALASNNEIVAKVAETSVSKIQVGQSVSIEADAYPGKSFKGKVTQVATQSTVEQNVTNFEVHISLEDPENLLTIAIVRQQQGTGVYVGGKGENGRPKFQLITTGVTVEDKTVVVSGLEEGDKVLISFPKGERPASRTPPMFPGMGPPGPGGSGGGRRGGG